MTQAQLLVPALQQVRQCRFCGCTPESPCRTEASDECGWATEACDVCTAKPCQIAWLREMKAMKRGRKKLVASLVQPVRESIERERVEFLKKVKGGPGTAKTIRRYRGKRKGGAV